MKTKILSNISGFFQTTSDLLTPKNTTISTEKPSRKATGAALFHAVENDSSMNELKKRQLANAIHIKPHILNKTPFSLAHELFACTRHPIAVGAGHAESKRDNYSRAMNEYIKDATEEEIETDYENLQNLVKQYIASQPTSTAETVHDAPDATR